VAEDKTIPNDTADNHGSIEVAEEAERLAAAIKESREYHEYIAAYNRLTHDEIEKLRAFKQTEPRMPGSMSFEDEKRVSHLYAMLNVNAGVKTFMEKERAVCGMMARVYDIIGDVHLFMFEE